MLAVRPGWIHLRRGGIGVTELDGRMSTRDVAEVLGVAESTVRAYLSRGQMPPADGHFEGPPWWRPETIKRWRETRRKGGE